MNVRALRSTPASLARGAVVALCIGVGALPRFAAAFGAAVLTAWATVGAERT